MLEGVNLFLNVVDPVSFGIRKSECLKGHSNAARAAFIPLNGAVVGLVKPLLLPVISAVGVVAFPIMAVIRTCQGRADDATAHFQAWQISIVTVAACFAFLMVTGFHLPAKTSIGLMAGIMATSIAFHVYRTESALNATPAIKK